jgi:membrane-bound inhibitor of C-type lysozyme
MMKNAIVAVIVGIVALSFGRPALAQKSFLYRCEDGTRLTATFDGMNSVRLEIGGSTIVLPIAMSGSGSRYADDMMTFWIKGNSAMLTRGKITTECQTK